VTLSEAEDPIYCTGCLVSLRSMGGIPASAYVARLSCGYPFVLCLRCQGRTDITDTAHLAWHERKRIEHVIVNFPELFRGSEAN
jgi:hypothetical protein